MEWPGLDVIKQQIITDREKNNINNPSRADFYYSYWEAYPEVPWVLLAHLISRNAGYQMSDLARYYDIMSKLTSPLELVNPPILGYSLSVLIDKLSVTSWDEIAASFALIEVGNYIIFRDVYPALAAYGWAKLFPSHSNELFKMLLDPPFDIDPFIQGKWKHFFSIVESKLGKKDWEEWSNNWSAGSDIQKHSFALIINEQNQIHDRVIHDKDDTYFPKFKVVRGPIRLLELANEYGFQTRLCFPVADEKNSKATKKLLIYVIDDFALINDRIQTGRHTFTDLFVTDKTRRQLVQTWVREHYRHHGTRWDYSPSKYSPQIDTGKIYSPALIRMDSIKASIAWPPKPGRQWPHLHQKPVEIPSINEWMTSVQENMWFAPLTVPPAAKRLVSCKLDDLCEIQF